MSDLITDAKSGRLVLAIRCRRRGHWLGAVYAIPAGLVVVSQYNSGRSTRKIAGEVLGTIKFLSETAWLLDDGYPPDFAGRSQEATVRCDCTEGHLDAGLLREKMASGTRVMLIDAVRTGTV